MKHSIEEKLQVIDEITHGKSIKAVCRSRGLDREVVRSWMRRYQCYGEDGFRYHNVGRRLSVEEKESIVCSHVQKNVPLSMLCLRHGVCRNAIMSWVRKYRSAGTLYNTKRTGRMGRPKKREPQTELEKLQAENLRLRAENALLKKVKALVEEQQARARLNGQKPSTN